MQMGVLLEIFPPLIFLGVGALTDFGPLIANPKTLILGGAAQFGVFATFIGAMFLKFTAPEAASIGIIGGAAIDVFDEEPLSPDSPLLTLDNVTLTPHIAGTTVDAFANSVEIMLRQLSLILAGKDAPNRVV